MSGATDSPYLRRADTGPISANAQDVAQIQEICLDTLVELQTRMLKEYRQLFATRLLAARGLKPGGASWQGLPQSLELPESESLQTTSFSIATKTPRNSSRQGFSEEESGSLHEQGVLLQKTKKQADGANSVASEACHTFKLWSEWIGTPDYNSDDLRARSEFYHRRRSGSFCTHYQKTVMNLTSLGEEHPDEGAMVSDCNFVMKPHSPARIAWEILAAVMLFWDLLTTPMQVFRIPKSLLTQVANTAIMLYWTLDIIATFLVGFYREDGELEMRSRYIISRYARHWLMFDIFIVATDWVTVFFEISGASKPDTLDSFGIARIGKLARVFRIFRVLRLLRLGKLKGAFQAVQEGVGSEYTETIFSLARNLSVICCINHILACIWYAIGSNGVVESEGWVEHYQYTHEPWEIRYFVSLHWSIAQFTPGASKLQPQTNRERIFGIFVLLFALVVFAMFVSNTTSQINRLFGLQATQKKKRLMLRSYLRQHKVPQELKGRVSRYVAIAQGNQRDVINQQDVELLRLLSRPLREELEQHLHMRTVAVHPFFKMYSIRSAIVMRKVCVSALTEICLSHADLLFSTGEVAVAMYFVTSGVMLYAPWQGMDDDGQLIRGGQWCCEPVLWTPWLHRGTMSADVDCELLGLNSAQFRNMVSQQYVDMWFAKQYGAAIVEALNRASVSGKNAITDLPGNLMQMEPVQKILTWQQPPSSSRFDDRSMGSNSSSSTGFSRSVGQDTYNFSGSGEVQGHGNTTGHLSSRSLGFSENASDGHGLTRYNL